MSKIQIMQYIFNQAVSQALVDRINQLTSSTQPQWGKMNVAQMMAHCSVAYRQVYEAEKFPAPNFFLRFMLKTFLKNTVVGEKPYKKNSQTAPAFKITDERIFETEKQQLIAFIEKTHDLGEQHFEGLTSNSFGKLTAKEWSNLFYKHLDHHLQQFGV